MIFYRIHLDLSTNLSEYFAKKRTLSRVRLRVKDNQ